VFASLFDFFLVKRFLLKFMGGTWRLLFYWVCGLLI